MEKIEGFGVITYDMIEGGEFYTGWLYKHKEELSTRKYYEDYFGDTMSKMSGWAMENYATLRAHPELTLADQEEMVIASGLLKREDLV